MLNRKIVVAFALLAVGLLLLSGCAGGSTGSAGDPIVGTWTFKGTAPKTDDPASGNYVLPEGSAAQTQEFRADGTYINPKGETRTWKRIDANTVEMAKVQATVVIKGNDLYETLGSKTLYWVKSK